jgi:hypothetical protein
MEVYKKQKSIFSQVNIFSTIFAADRDVSHRWFCEIFLVSSSQSSFGNYANEKNFF